MGIEWIVSDDIERETWRRLHEYANIDLATDYLTSRHGAPKDQQEKRNRKKQAEQTRFCLLQAKEYFDAARLSSLYTSPNHLYYGLVALTSAQMLLLGDGTSSLDYRRQDPANGHHGLRFTTGCNASSARHGLTILDSSYAEVLRSGHFVSWYSHLPSRMDIYAQVTAEMKEGTFVDSRVFGGYEMAKSAAMIGRRRTALELLRCLPDLAQDFNRYRMPVSAARSSQEVRVRHDAPTRHLWTFHQIFDRTSPEKLLERFQVPPRFAEYLHARATASGSLMAVEAVIPDLEGFEIRYPESRDTMDHETITYFDSIDTHELVDSFVIAFQLSMLSRYYPDLWVGCIESHCKASKLIDRAVETLIKKAPLLALSLISPHGVTISTHRAPWK